MTLAHVILALAATHLALGAIVAGWVMFVRRAPFDPDARASSLGFRIITLPGAILLWPALLIAARRSKAPIP